MTVPAETRVLILEHLLINQGTIKQEVENPYFGNWSRASTFSEFINISLTCKTVYREAHEVFYKNNRFYIQNIMAGDSISVACNMIRGMEGFNGKRFYLQKTETSLMLPETWQTFPLFHINFQSVSYGFKELADKFRIIDELRAVHQTQTDLPITKVKSLDITIPIPRSFPMCHAHSANYRERYQTLINPSILAKDMEIKDLRRCNDGAKYFHPHSRLLELDSDFKWEYMPEAEEHARALSEQVEFAFRWEMVDLTPDALRGEKCGWFRLRFLLELHRKFDHGGKYAKRRAWLLGLGGSDDESLL